MEEEEEEEEEAVKRDVLTLVTAGSDEQMAIRRGDAMPYKQHTSDIASVNTYCPWTKQ